MTLEALAEVKEWQAVPDDAPLDEEVKPLYCVATAWS
jgi:hypothetical protein